MSRSGIKTVFLLQIPKATSVHVSVLTPNLGVFQGEPGGDNTAPGPKGEAGYPGLPVTHTREQLPPGESPEQRGSANQARCRANLKSDPVCSSFFLQKL